MTTLASAPPSKPALEHGPHGSAGAAPSSFHFLLRRLHSLAGILFGGYIVVHLTVNATGLWPRAYQLNVDRIHALGPLLPVVEVAAIFAPLLLHMIYGVYIAFVGVKFNTMHYNYGGNVRYFLQRWTAVILLVFILFHIGTLHKWGIRAIYELTGEKLSWLSDWGGRFHEVNRAFQSTADGIRTYFRNDPADSPLNMGVMGLYLLGVWSASFHFANGLWTAAIAWGLTVTARAQKRWGHVCLVLGIMMFTIGTIAWAAFTIVPNNAYLDSSELNRLTHTIDENVPQQAP